MEKLKNKYLEIGELTKEQIKWINKEIPGTLDLDFDYYKFSFINDIFVSSKGITKDNRELISFDEFKEIYESYKFVLPDKWCVKHYPETLKWIQENAEYNAKKITERNFYNFPCSESGNNSSVNILKGYTEITFEQFKEHVLGKENINKLNNILTDISEKVQGKLKEKYKPTKEIIGYKLVKPEYKEAVREILKNSCDHGWFDIFFNSNINRKGFNFGASEDNEIKKDLLQAGVLNIWFKEVYEKESITLKSGVKLSEDDIAEVKEILNNK